uniref:Plasmid related protein n=1 Tax=Solibacter usitatus (strain Ellin6076) TaxID=234267 RepID=Q028F7_SOLUE
MGIARFAIGQIVATPGALQALEEVGENPAGLLKRHVTGDWGELDEHDRLENERSLEDGRRLLSAYVLSTGVKLWIITEADRTVTTLLLPSEY